MKSARYKAAIHFLCSLHFKTQLEAERISLHFVTVTKNAFLSWNLKNDCFFQFQRRFLNNASTSICYAVRSKLKKSLLFHKKNRESGSTLIGIERLPGSICLARLVLCLFCKNCRVFCLLRLSLTQRRFK